MIDQSNPTYAGAEGGGLLLTGPISGTVVLKDGTPYNVTPKVIEHAPGHAGPICHHIAKMHEAAGTHLGLTGSETHVCTEFCAGEGL